jgi:hypothetical protein
MDHGFNSTYGTSAMNSISPPEQPLMDEAGRAVSLSHGVHNLIDDLEDRLFGAQPRGVAVSIGAEKTRPALAETVRETRQRLDSATDRLQSILNRL